MAVTKIRRISRRTHIIAVLISIVVMALFYLGGQVPAHEKIAADMSQPKYIDIVLYWSYIILAITVVVWLLFSIFGFFKQLKESPKKAIAGLLVLAVFAALLFITYTIGSGKLLDIPGYEGADNNPTTLKLTDMWLYSSYVMLGLNFLALVFLPLIKRRR